MQGGIRWVWSTQVDIHFVSVGGVLSTKVEILLFFLAGMGRVCSTQVEIYFVSSLLWAGFGQSKLRYILCSLWHGMGLVNTS